MSHAPRDLPAIAGGRPVRERPLPFFRAAVGEDDIAAVSEALRSGWLTSGPRAIELEKKLGEYLGAAHTIAVSSCSEAMMLCLRALGIGPGDEVITSPITFASTVHAIIHNGATPVLADIENDTFCVDPADVERRITPRTRAIMPVHFAGQACRINEIMNLASARGLDVVEDAAHSFGARVDGKRIGTFGCATAFSFYATKNLTTAEGGAITTQDEALAKQLRLLGYHGMSRDSWSRYTDRGSWYYEVELPGYKCNLSDLHAALGLTQLAKIDHLLEERRRVAAALTASLSSCDAVELPHEYPGNWHTWHLYVVRLRLERLAVGRDEFIKALRAEGIGSSVHFIPVHHHPFFQPYLRKGDAFPHADDFYSRCISLPIFPDMTDADVRDVADAVTRLAAHFRANVMQIERLDGWSGELDELASGASGATFYHTGTWLCALGAAYPRMTLRVLVARDGNARLAFLPFFESHRGPLRALWSLPFGTYGGPVGDARACDELWREYRSFFSSPGVIDLGCIDRDSVLPADGWETTELSTHVVDISRGFDHLWHQQFDKPRRRRVRRAVEAGVTVRRGTGTHDMAAFMHVYRERLNNWKGSGHPETLFFALLEHGGAQVRLYVAEHGGAVVGGHLNFYYKDAVIAWYGMTSTQAGDTQAGTLLYSECMREACDAGFRSYNLGASLGKQSLIEYKESLGGTPHVYRMLRRRRLGGRVAALMRRASRPA